LNLKVVIGLLFDAEDLMRFTDSRLVDMVCVLLLLLFDLLYEELLLVEHLLVTLLLLQHHLHLYELRVEAVLFLRVGKGGRLLVLMVLLPVSRLVFEAQLMGGTWLLSRSLSCLKMTIFSCLLR
jgi:hypothetical protein